MRALMKSVLTAGCLLLLAVPARAQAPGVDIRLNPRIGLYTPLTDLTDASSTIEAAKLDNSLAIGLGIEFDFAMLPVGLRANLDYATSSSVNFENSSINDTNETTLLALTGDLIFRPLPRVVVLQPYLFAGGGIKKYDFSWDAASVETIENDSDPTIHLGGGLDFGLGPLALNAELGDYMSWFKPADGEDSTMQHDLFVTVGFSIGLL